MNIKDIVVRFLKNLGVGLVCTLASFSSVVFVVLSAFGDKVSYQGGELGHAAASVVIAWFVVSVAAFPPLMVVSAIVTYLQLRKKA